MDFSHIRLVGFEFCENATPQSSPADNSKKQQTYSNENDFCFFVSLAFQLFVEIRFLASPFFYAAPKIGSFLSAQLNAQSTKECGVKNLFNIRA